MAADPPDAEDIDDTLGLLERAKAGDQQALEELFSRHVPLLKRWASGRLPRWARDITDTSDLVQETVMQTFKRLDAFEPRGKGALQAYLRQAVMNRIRNQIRNVGARPEGVELATSVPDGGTSPLEAAIGQELAEDYEAALNRLTADEREAIINRVELGLSFAEVAEVLGKPSPDAARMTVVRALVRLAEEMGRR